MVQPLMPFSESATPDLNSVAFKGMHLSKADNRQVVFAGLWTPLQPLWRPGEVFHPELVDQIFPCAFFFLSLNLSQSYGFGLF